MLFPFQDWWVVPVKVVFDQTVWSAIWNSIYFTVLGFLRLESPLSIFKELKATFLPMLTVRSFLFFPLYLQDSRFESKHTFDYELNAGRVETLAVCSFDHIRFGTCRTTTSLGWLRGAYLGHYTFDVSIKLKVFNVSFFSLISYCVLDFSYSNEKSETRISDSAIESSLSSTTSIDPSKVLLTYNKSIHLLHFDTQEHRSNTTSLFWFHDRNEKAESQNSVLSLSYCIYIYTELANKVAKRSWDCYRGNEYIQIDGSLYV